MGSSSTPDASRTRPRGAASESSAGPSASEFYSAHGIVTDPGAHAGLLDGLPRDIGRLCEIVQGLLVHIFWAERMGLTLSEERKQEVQLRSVARQLGRIRALDDRPLTEARPLDKRLVGNCRDFSVLLCAMLRHQGVPARARCGFGTYFIPGRYEDHWTCEFWSEALARWVRVDPQLDALQRQALDIRFDPLDMPPEPFVTGGLAWRMCRAGQANPEDFGIFDMHGLWFVQGDLIRDLLSLNKIEILPWDRWGRMAGPGQEPLPAELAYLDNLAELTLGVDSNFDEVRAVCVTDQALHIPEGWVP